MAPRKPTKSVVAAKAVAAPKVARALAAPAAETLKQADEGYRLARKDAVKYLHGRRQAMFALARRYHLDAEDIEQEGYEVLLTCLRDFNPSYTKATGEVATVQFNTFFGSRLEGKALELRNRDPEYQARQAHMADMSDEQKSEFRNNPPLLVQHLDQQTTMQEQLSGEVSQARRSSQMSAAMKVAHDSFVEKKLNQLIAQERDDKRRAALMHVKVGGVSSFDEIAYHFGVTDSRASQILNELMDAFYVQRLLDGDLKSVAYDWKKLKIQPKRAHRLLEEAMAHTTPARAADIHGLFHADYAGLALPAAAPATTAMVANTPLALQFNPTFSDPFTAEEDARYPLQGLEWRNVGELTPLHVPFRNPADEQVAEPPHIAAIMEREADNWPLIVTPDGQIVDGARRWRAAKARGKDKLLCLVRGISTLAEASIMRVIANVRQVKPDRMDLYFAIAALADLGLSQQKIATAIGTSRPNVIVYAKVKDKATPKLRALFEDGLIQITNASACVELAAGAQDGLAEFVRRYGPQWGKGPQFNEVFEAAAAGKLAKLAAGQPDVPAAGKVTPVVAAPQVPAVASEVAMADTHVVHALRQRQAALEQALRDAEVWNKQREGVVARQTEDMAALKQEVEALKREVQAHDLLKYGDEATIAGLMKEFKTFYAQLERLVGAAYQLDKVAKALRGQPLSFSQMNEVQQQADAMEASLSAIRLELSNRNRRS